MANSVESGIETIATPQVRLFVSSTFRDMQEEREALVKTAFPRLRKLCETRGGTWAEVDLRWGITDEAAAERGVLPLCLAEIDRCRPFFIAVLGRRYGFVPESVSETVLASYPWLAGYADRSVTELEIRHAVLSTSRPAAHSLFYFLDDGVIPASVGDVSANRAKLHALKDEIYARGLPISKYRDAAHLARLVEHDLSGLINRLYPGVPASHREMDTIAQGFFVRRRAAIVIRRRRLEARLNEWHDGSQPALIVCGPAGSGKSTGTTAWIESLRTEPPPHGIRRWLALSRVRRSAAHRSVLWIRHHVGATAGSGYWPSLVRRIMDQLELPARTGEDGSAADRFQLIGEFNSALSAAVAGRRVGILLDGLDQVEARDQGHSLEWLPRELPDGMRLVVTVRPGPLLERLADRGWPSSDIEPLDATERRTLAEQWLARYGKQLSRGLMPVLLDAHQAGNALFLRLLLDEIRQFGDHELLEETVRRYLRAGAPEELFGMILERLERDFGGARFVGRAMVHLVAARRGLSEAEVLDLLEAWGGEARRSWASLSLALADSLVEASGLFTFFHAALPAAVAARYLKEADARTESHARLAAYFRTRGGRRAAEELPFQLRYGNKAADLVEVLSDRRLLADCWASEPFEVLGHWEWLRSAHGIDPVGAYLGVRAPEPASGESVVARLLASLGYVETAIEMGTAALREQVGGGCTAEVESWLGHQAVLNRTLGRLTQSLACLGAQERCARELNDRAALQRCLGNRGAVLADLGRDDEALAAHAAEEELCLLLRDDWALAVSRANCARILFRQGQHRQANTLAVKAERAARLQGHVKAIAICLGMRAAVALERGKRRTALRLFEEEGALVRRIGDLFGTMRNLAHRVVVLQELDDFDAAHELANDLERLWRSLPRPNALLAAVTLETRGNLNWNVGAINQAVQLLEKAAESYRQAGALRDAERVAARLR